MKLTHRTMFVVVEHDGPTQPIHIDYNPKLSDLLSLHKLMTIGFIRNRFENGELEQAGVYELAWFRRGRKFHTRLHQLS